VDVSIVTEGLTKDHGAFRALDGLSLRVERGEIFGFLGPNGAGKTTTIRLLLDLIRPAFGEDFRVGIEMPRQVWGALASLPAADRAFAVMASDGHGTPPVLARHETPVDGVDAADRYGVWRLADALFACAVDGRWCEDALGNTPAQRFMGTWSDGVPVAELAVTDDPHAS
jgi:energy-coupling factor transporter ATP-binding protein EcfA2